MMASCSCCIFVFETRSSRWPWVRLGPLIAVQVLAGPSRLIDFLVDELAEGEAEDEEDGDGCSQDGDEREEAADVGVAEFVAGGAAARLSRRQCPTRRRDRTGEAEGLSCFWCLAFADQAWTCSASRISGTCGSLRTNTGRDFSCVK